MGHQIHETAFVDPSAELGDGVRIGPLAIVGASVVLGDDTEVAGHGHVQGPAKLGRENVIYPQACVGFDPQDKKYEGEETTLEVGDRNIFRELCTINRGTGPGGGVTRVGSDNLFLTGAHVGHDCTVGDSTVFVNNATLGGHVEMQDWATLGAFSSVHPFARIGAHAYIGGYSIITMDVLPFGTTVGQKPQCYGANRIGLERRGFTADEIEGLNKAFRLLLRSKLNTTQAIERIEAELAGQPHVDFLVSFLRSSERGVIKAGRKGSRGAG